MSNSSADYEIEALHQYDVNLATLIAYVNAADPAEVAIGLFEAHDTCLRQHAIACGQDAAQIKAYVCDDWLQSSPEYRPQTVGLLYEYLNTSPDCHEIFSLWESLGKRNTSRLACAIPEFLATVIHYAPIITATSILRRCLKDFNKTIISNLGSSSPRLIKATVRLLACGAQLNASSARDIQQRISLSFKGWTVVAGMRTPAHGKQLSNKVAKAKLASRRNIKGSSKKGKGKQDVDSLLGAGGGLPGDDARSWLVRLTSRMLMCPAGDVVHEVLRTSGFLWMTVRYLKNDHPAVIREFLSAALHGLCYAPSKVPRKMLLEALNSGVLKGFLTVYDRRTPLQTICRAQSDEEVTIPLDYESVDEDGLLWCITSWRTPILRIKANQKPPIVRSLIHNFMKRVLVGESFHMTGPQDRSVKNGGLFASPHSGELSHMVSHTAKTLIQDTQSNAPIVSEIPIDAPNMASVIANVDNCGNNEATSMPPGVRVAEKFLRTLDVVSDSLQRQLLTKLLQRHPSLQQTFFQSWSHSMEPRASEQWYHSVEFLRDLLMSPVDLMSKLMSQPEIIPVPHIIAMLHKDETSNSCDSGSVAKPDSDSYFDQTPVRSSSTPLGIMLKSFERFAKRVPDLMLPQGMSRQMFTKGLLHKEEPVRLSSIELLIAALTKIHATITLASEAIHAQQKHILEEMVTMTQCSLYSSDAAVAISRLEKKLDVIFEQLCDVFKKGIISMVRTRFPEISTLIHVYSKLTAEKQNDTQEETDKIDESNIVTFTRLVAALRVFYMLFPNAFADVNFDITSFVLRPLPRFPLLSCPPPLQYQLLKLATDTCIAPSVSALGDTSMTQPIEASSTGVDPFSCCKSPSIMLWFETTKASTSRRKKKSTATSEDYHIPIKEILMLLVKSSSVDVRQATIALLTRILSFSGLFGNAVQSKEAINIWLSCLTIAQQPVISSWAGVSVQKKSICVNIESVDRKSAAESFFHLCQACLLLSSDKALSNELNTLRRAFETVGSPVLSPISNFMLISLSIAMQPHLMESFMEKTQQISGSIQPINDTIQSVSSSPIFFTHVLHRILCVKPKSEVDYAQAMNNVILASTQQWQDSAKHTELQPLDELSVRVWDQFQAALTRLACRSSSIQTKSLSSKQVLKQLQLCTAPMHDTNKSIRSLFAAMFVQLSVTELEDPNTTAAQVYQTWKNEVSADKLVIVVALRAASLSRFTQAFLLHLAVCSQTDTTAESLCDTIAEACEPQQLMAYLTFDISTTDQLDVAWYDAIVNFVLSSICFRYCHQKSNSIYILRDEEDAVQSVVQCGSFIATLLSHDSIDTIARVVLALQRFLLGESYALDTDTFIHTSKQSILSAKSSWRVLNQCLHNTTTSSKSSTTLRLNALLVTLLRNIYLAYKHAFNETQNDTNIAEHVWWTHGHEEATHVFNHCIELFDTFQSMNDINELCSIAAVLTEFAPSYVLDAILTRLCIASKHTQLIRYQYTLLTSIFQHIQTSNQDIQFFLQKLVQDPLPYQGLLHLIVLDTNTELVDIQIKFLCALGNSFGTKIDQFDHLTVLICSRLVQYLSTVLTKETELEKVNILSIASAIANLIQNSSIVLSSIQLALTIDTTSTTSQPNSLLFIQAMHQLQQAAVLSVFDTTVDDGIYQFLESHLLSADIHPLVLYWIFGDHISLLFQQIPANQQFRWVQTAIKLMSVLCSPQATQMMLTKGFDGFGRVLSACSTVVSQIRVDNRDEPKASLFLNQTQWKQVLAMLQESKFLVGPQIHTLSRCIYALSIDSEGKEPSLVMKGIDLLLNRVSESMVNFVRQDMHLLSKTIPECESIASESTEEVCILQCASIVSGLHALWHLQQSHVWSIYINSIQEKKVDQLEVSSSRQFVLAGILFALSISEHQDMATLLQSSRNVNTIPAVPKGTVNLACKIAVHILQTMKIDQESESQTLLAPHELTGLVLTHPNFVDVLLHGAKQPYTIYTEPQTEIVSSSPSPFSLWLEYASLSHSTYTDTVLRSTTTPLPAAQLPIYGLFQMLHWAISTNPTELCHRSFLPVWLVRYKGSMSSSDILIRETISIFEEHGVTWSTFQYAWSAGAISHVHLPSLHRFLHSKFQKSTEADTTHSLSIIDTVLQQFKRNCIDLEMVTQPLASLVTVSDTLLHRAIDMIQSYRRGYAQKSSTQQLQESSMNWFFGGLETSIDTNGQSSDAIHSDVALRQFVKLSPTEYGLSLGRIISSLAEFPMYRALTNSGQEQQQQICRLNDFETDGISASVEFQESTITGEPILDAEKAYRELKRLPSTSTIRHSKAMYNTNHSSIDYQTTASIVNTGLRYIQSGHTWRNIPIQNHALISDEMFQSSLVNSEWDSVIARRKMYDPQFLLPALLHILSSGIYSPRKFASSGALAYALMALSSARLDVRQAAFSIIGAYAESIESENIQGFRERPQVLLVLSALRNSVVLPFQRIPAVICAFLGECVLIQLRPSHAMYSAVNGFLLGRPQGALDLRDIPLFMSSLYSSTSAANARAAERSFILRLLSRGIHTTADINALRRRHGISILLDYLNMPLLDSASRHSILHILARAARIRVQYVGTATPDISGDDDEEVMLVDDEEDNSELNQQTSEAKHEYTESTSKDAQSDMQSEQQHDKSQESTEIDATDEIGSLGFRIAPVGGPLWRQLGFSYWCQQIFHVLSPRIRHVNSNDTKFSDLKSYTILASRMRDLVKLCNMFRSVYQAAILSIQQRESKFLELSEPFIHPAALDVLPTSAKNPLLHSISGVIRRAGALGSDFRNLAIEFVKHGSQHLIHFPHKCTQESIHQSLFVINEAFSISIHTQTWLACIIMTGIDKNDDSTATLSDVLTSLDDCSFPMETVSMLISRVHGLVQRTQKRNSRQFLLLCDMKLIAQSILTYLSRFIELRTDIAVAFNRNVSETIASHQSLFELIQEYLQFVLSLNNALSTFSMNSFDLTTLDAELSILLKYLSTCISSSERSHPLLTMFLSAFGSPVAHTTSMHTYSNLLTTTFDIHDQSSTMYKTHMYAIQSLQQPLNNSTKVGTVLYKLLTLHEQMKTDSSLLTTSNEPKSGKKKMDTPKGKVFEPHTPKQSSTLKKRKRSKEISKTTQKVPRSSKKHRRASMT